MKFLIVIIMFLVIGGLFVISNNNLELCKKENIKDFSNLYFSWLENVYLNFRVITGNMIKLDWVPK